MMSVVMLVAVLVPLCVRQREGPKERLRTDSELITTNEKSSQVKGHKCAYTQTNEYMCWGV